MKPSFLPEQLHGISLAANTGSACLINTSLVINRGKLGPLGLGVRMGPKVPKVALAPMEIQGLLGLLERR